VERNSECKLKAREDFCRKTFKHLDVPYEISGYTKSMLEPYVSKGNRASVAACRSAEMNVLFRRFSRRD
jgi:hypothetical protein